MRMHLPFRLFLPTITPSTTTLYGPHSTGTLRRWFMGFRYLLLLLLARHSFHITSAKSSLPLLNSRANFSKRFMLEILSTPHWRSSIFRGKGRMASSLPESPSSISNARSFSPDNTSISSKRFCNKSQQKRRFQTPSWSYVELIRSRTEENRNASNGRPKVPRRTLVVHPVCPQQNSEWPNRYGGSRLVLSVGRSQSEFGWLRGCVWRGCSPADL